MGIQIRAGIIPLCVGELIAKSWGQVWFLYRNMDFFVFFLQRSSRPQYSPELLQYYTVIL